jgi:hypothetical protein
MGSARGVIITINYDLRRNASFSLVNQLCFVILD